MSEVALAWLRQQGVEFRAPGLLWGLLLVPALMLAYAGAARARRRVAGAFEVKGRPRRRPALVRRALAQALLLLGLTALTVGFARPVLPLETPDDHATVVLVLDASLSMRATDVRPTRFEAARAAARAALAAMPDRLQVAVVGYARTAYILEAPTHDHGAALVAISQVRTSEGAAPGDAIAVALATIPSLDAVFRAAGNTPAAGAGGAPPGRDGPAPKVPSAIVLIGSGELTAGRSLGEAAAAAREAGVPVHTVPIGPRPGEEQKAPYEPGLLRQLAQVTGGKALAAPRASDWREVYRAIGSAVTVERKPQEVGHFVGASALVVTALSMAVSLWATRRLV